MIMSPAATPFVLVYLAGAFVAILVAGCLGCAP